VVAPNSGGIVYVTSGGGGAEAYYTAPNDLISQSIGVNNYVHAEVSATEITLKVRGLGQRGDIDSIVLAPEPQVFSAVNSASLTTDLASGGALTILGRNMSPAAFQSSLAAPLLIGHGCSATLNGVPVPIVSANAGQMNLQIPFDFVGSANLQVLTKNGTVQTTVQVAPVAPQFFMNTDGSVVAAHADGSPVNANSPANPSEMITLFLTGLGAVNKPVQAGVLPPAGVAAVAPVQLTMGGIAVPASPAVLSVSSPGTYQIQVQVPAGIQGPAVVQAKAISVLSNAPFLSL
jgi:uncharacterized protein (TIGR03437 family)